MRDLKSILAVLMAAVLVLCGCSDSKRLDKIGKTEVTIKTNRGKIVIRLYDDTPEYRDNFLTLVKKGAYDGTVWHRIVPGKLIQAGTVNESKYAGPTLPAEIIYPKHFHKAGALAAAREDDIVNPDKRSSNTQFYIVTGTVFTPASLAQLHEQLVAADTTANPIVFSDYQKKVYTTVGGTPHLDNEYTVFGEVVDGLGVVQNIGNEKVNGEKPIHRLVIESITVTGE